MRDPPAAIYFASREGLAAEEHRSGDPRPKDGDVRRFESPRQLMAFLGLVPSERSTGDTVRRGGLTLAGNRRVRRALVEGAWSYRHPARVTETIRVRLENLPKAVREIAWKARSG